VYHKAGVRHYLWRDKLFAEIELDRMARQDLVKLLGNTETLKEEVKVRKMLKMWDVCTARHSRIPMPTDCYDVKAARKWFSITRPGRKSSGTRRPYIRSIYYVGDA